MATPLKGLDEATLNEIRQEADRRLGGWSADVRETYVRGVQRLKEGRDMRDIEIRAVLNGFIVRVGCQHIVFDNLGSGCIDKLLEHLREYLAAPGKVEEQFTTTPWARKVMGSLHAPWCDGPETGTPETAVGPSAEYVPKTSLR